MKLVPASIFLFVVITMAVGTGVVIAQGSEPTAEPTPTPTPSGQPVKTLVTVTAPSAAVEVSQAPATSSPVSSPSSGTFYNPPAPKSYTPGNYQAPSQVSAASGASPASYYSNVSQPNMLNYAAVPNAAPGATKTSVAPANTAQPATSPSSPAASPVSNPAPASATTTINIPTDGNVSTGVSVVGSNTFGFADVTQYTSHPGSTTGSINISVGVTE